VRRAPIGQGRDANEEISVRLRHLALVLVATFLPMSAAHAQSPWNSVTLTWTAPGDDSLTGNASQYDLRVSNSPITSANFLAATRVTGVPAPAAPGISQSFTVPGLSPSTTYYFAILTADEVPNWSGISNLVTRVTDGAPDVIRPAAANLNVTIVGDTAVTVAWLAVGDDSLSGTATSYDMRYSTAPITAANWGSATQAAGEPAPGTPGSAQSMLVHGLARQRTYYFALQTKDEVGNPSALSNVPSATTLDTLRPAAIRNLAASFVWLSWHTALATLPRGTEHLPR
jgi:hypothetical protein